MKTDKLSRPRIQITKDPVLYISWKKTRPVWCVLNAEGKCLGTYCSMQLAHAHCLNRANRFNKRKSK